MPNYDFYNKETDEIETHTLRMSELDEFKENNPHLERRISAPAIVGGVSGSGVKNDGGWAENMSRIAAAHPGSPLADRYGTRSAKEIKTREVLKKHGVLDK